MTWFPNFQFRCIYSNSAAAMCQSAQAICGWSKVTGLLAGADWLHPTFHVTQARFLGGAPGRSTS